MGSEFGYKSTCLEIQRKREKKVHKKSAVRKSKRTERNKQRKMESSDDEVEPVDHPVAVAVWQPAAGHTLLSVLGTVAHKM